jgi:Aspartyl protease
VRLLRRRVDPRVEEATAAHAAGDFVRARELAREVVAEGDASPDVLRGLGELEYLLGGYEAAEALLRRVAEEASRDVARRVDAEVALALVHFQTNRYSEAAGLFAGIEGIDLPIWELMTSFGDEEPYRVDWGGHVEAALPFIQTTTWELPCVRLEVDGLAVDGRIDTGGELLTLSPDVAAALGVEPVVTAEGVFAAGARGELGYGRVGSVRLGPLTVRAVPVAVMGLERPVIGTGLLRQFLATLDYPAGRLVLRPRSGSRPGGGVEVPFALAATHLLIARGALDDREPVTFILDSGLEDEGGASVALPRATLDLLGNREPPPIEDVGESGAGSLSLRFGRFPLSRVALGTLEQEDASGLSGIFPDAWAELGGVAIHGILSHGFLRRYAWTLDFEQMTMSFAEPD